MTGGDHSRPGKVHIPRRSAQDPGQCFVTSDGPLNDQLKASAISVIVPPNARSRCDCNPAFLYMLNAFTLPDDVALCGSPIRAEMLDMLAAEFRTAFTGIEYEIDTHTRIVNAQAFGFGDKRIVRLYGGLAFHPLVNEDALVFSLLHETGHHRARGRRFAGDPMIACDCLADKWAIGAGANALRRASGRTMNLANALDSLEALIVSIEDGARLRLTAPAARARKKPEFCWTGCWQSRKSRLTEGNAPAPIGPCYYQFPARKRKRRKKWVH